MTWTTRPRSDLGPLRAIRAGHGAPLVLLHGVGLRAEAWGAQLDTFARQYEVIAPDMPGHGESPPLTAAPALDLYVDALATALPDGCCVAGHSMGAMIALRLAERFPERVAGVAALCAIYRRGAGAAQAVQARADALDPGAAPDPAPTLARWFADTAAPEARACDGWLRGGDPAGYKAAYTVFAAEDGPTEDALRGLHAPALFLTGAGDPNSTPAMSRAMAALAPRGTAQAVQGAAHMLPMTHPDATNAALTAWLAQCQGA